MEAFRLSREKYPASALSGKGAAMKGARWNSIAVEMIYTASNRSLAMAEVAVHMTLATLPDDYLMNTIFIPDTISLIKMQMSELPVDWNTFPYPPTTPAIGDRFIAENRYCILHIPSAVTQGDFNLLINPYHTEFKKISIIKTERFLFDKRIFQ
jgi:RES domain-containing protein